MRLLQIYVKTNKLGEPIWDSLHVKMAPPRTELRKFRVKFSQEKAIKDAHKPKAKRSAGTR
jgi:hypothetical protein